MRTKVQSDWISRVEIRFNNLLFNRNKVSIIYFYKNYIIKHNKQALAKATSFSYSYIKSLYLYPISTRKTLFSLSKIISKNCLYNYITRNTVKLVLVSAMTGTTDLVLQKQISLLPEAGGLANCYG